MSRALLVFVLVLAALGLGTALIVEKYSNERILPRSFHGVSVAELQRSWAKGVKAVKSIWQEWVGKAGAATESPVSQQRPVTPASGPEPQIIKWQDERGVWHYEYASPEASAAPASPP